MGVRARGERSFRGSAVWGQEPVRCWWEGAVLGGEEREDREKMAEAFSVGRVESKHLLNLEAAAVSGQCRHVGWSLVHWAFAESVDPGGPRPSQENTGVPPQQQSVQKGSRQPKNHQAGSPSSLLSLSHRV